MTNLEQLVQLLINGEYERFNELKDSLGRGQITLPTKQFAKDGWLDLKRLDLSLFDLRGVTLSGLRCENCAFEGERVAGVQFEDCVFMSCRFRPMGTAGASFENCRFEGGRFQGVKMATFKMFACVFTDDNEEKPTPVLFDDACQFKGFSARGNAWNSVRVDNNAQGKILVENSSRGISLPKPPKKQASPRTKKRSMLPPAVKKR